MAWVVAFCVVVGLMIAHRLRDPVARAGVQLELVEGAQLRGIYRQGRRLGSASHRVSRTDRGWRLDERFLAQRAGQEAEVAHARLHLRRDLSMERLSLEVDLSQLATLTGVGAGVAQRLGLGELRLRGKCGFRSGRCDLEGSMGQRPISRSVNVGRGPVLPSAIYPLLARGVLGKQVELSLVDPMTLQRRPVSYALVGRRPLKLGSQQFDALLVKQRISGISTDLWLDRRGRVLKEQLPLGISIQHESWSLPSPGSL